MFLIKEKPLGFGNKKILIIWFSLALYLFSEIVLPLNAVYSYTFYDDDVENECCELCQNIHANHINIDKKCEDEEIDNDSFLYSSLIKEKHFCIVQICNLNLESILSTYSQIFKIMLFDVKSKQNNNNIDSCLNNENTLEILRTVILVI